MTADEIRRLELARRAWQAAAPSEQEVERAVRRVRRSLASAGRGRSRRRKLPALAAAALVLGGALAYAASGGFSALRSAGAPSERRQSSGSTAGDAQADSVRERSGKVAGATERRAESKAGAPAQTATAAQPAAPPAAPSSGRPAKASIPNAAKNANVDSDLGWREVGEALAAGDEARASRALKALSQDPDAETRAKAELGLARLAAGASDCERARRLALRVARTPGLDDKLIERAHDVIMRCDGR